MAAKKTTKKSTKKNPATPRASRSYELTAKGNQMLTADEFGPQPKLIAQALSRKGQATSGELAAAIDSKVETTQPVARVVGYYLTTWKTDGIVRVVKATKKAAA
jgi:hypothetical protein